MSIYLKQRTVEDPFVKEKDVIIKHFFLLHFYPLCLHSCSSGPVY